MKDETKYFFQYEVIVRNVTLVKLYAKKAKCGDKARDICKADDLLSCNDVKPVYYPFSGIEDLNFAIPSVRASHFGSS